MNTFANLKLTNRYIRYRSYSGFTWGACVANGVRTACGTLKIRSLRKMSFDNQRYYTLKKQFRRKQEITCLNLIS